VFFVFINVGLASGQAYFAAQILTLIICPLPGASAVAHEDGNASLMTRIKLLDP